MKHPIDDYFKDKLREQEFTFHTEDWNGVKKMLYKRRNRRRVIIFWILTAIALVVTFYHIPLKQLLISKPMSDATYASEHNLESKIDKSSPIDEQYGSESTEIITSEKNFLGDLKQSLSQNNIRTSLPKQKNGTEQIQQLSSTANKINEIRQPNIFHGPINQVNYGKLDEAVFQDVPYTEGENFENSNYPIHKSRDELPSKVTLSFHPLQKLSLSPLANSIEENEDYLKLIEKTIEPGHLAMLADELNIVIQSFGFPSNNAPSKFWRGFTAGFEYSRGISSRLSLRTGLGFHYQNGSFGKDSAAERDMNSSISNPNVQVVEYSPEALYYLHVPFSLLWTKNKHHILTGIDLNHLLAVRGEELTQSFSTLDLPGMSQDASNVEITEISKTWLPKSSFNTLLWQAHLDYRYSFFNNFSLGIGLRYLLNDMQKSTSDLSINETNDFLGSMSLIFHF